MGSKSSNVSFLIVTSEFFRMVPILCAESQVFSVTSAGMTTDGWSRCLHPVDLEGKGRKKLKKKLRIHGFHEFYRNHPISLVALTPS